MLGIGRVALWRTRAAYLKGGVQLAVFDIARPGRPRRYDTDAEARVTALACARHSTLHYSPDQGHRLMQERGAVPSASPWNAGRMIGRGASPESRQALSSLPQS